MSEWDDVPGDWSELEDTDSLEGNYTGNRAQNENSFDNMVSGWECMYCNKVNMVHTYQHCIFCDEERLNPWQCSDCTYVHEANVHVQLKAAQNGMSDSRAIRSIFVVEKPGRCAICGSWRLQRQYLSYMYNREKERKRHLSVSRELHRLSSTSVAEAERISTLPLTDEQKLEKIRITISNGGVPAKELDHPLIRANHAPINLLNLTCKHNNIVAAKWLLDRGFNMQQKDDEGLQFQDKYFPNDVFFGVQSRLMEKVFQDEMKDVFEGRYISEIVRIIAEYLFWYPSGWRIQDGGRTF